MWMWKKRHSVSCITNIFIPGNGIRLVDEDID